MRSHPQSHTLGVTLVELMVGMSIGLFVVAAAVTFTSHQARWLSFTGARLEAEQSGRVALDILADDLRHAGLGLGYDGAGRFAGLLRGSFTVPGGARFEADDRALAGGIVTDDLGIRTADEGIATIADFSDLGGQLCKVGGFQIGDLVTMVSEDALSVRTARLTALDDDACRYAACAPGCWSFLFDPDPTYLSDAFAANALYTGGEMFRGYKVIVWHAAPDPGIAGGAVLQRAAVSADAPCAAVGCGGTIATNVESLQVRVWQWDPRTQGWVDRTRAAAVDGRDRIRVDVELVLEGRPAYRTAVELRNAGRQGVQ